MGSVMWAYRLVGPSRLESCEVSAPLPEQLEPGQVLLRGLAGGICGSDLPKFAGVKGVEIDADGRHVPAAPGWPMHEVVGVVAASRHPAIHEGQSVVGWASRSDALAEYVLTGGDDVAVVNSGLTAAHAVLAQPLACVIHALDRVDVTGVDVAVIGLGPIGLLFTHMVRHLGARSVTGIDPVDRTDVAQACGVDRLVVAGSDTWSTRPMARPQVVIEAVGHQVATLGHAIRAVETDGAILYFGIPDQSVYPVDMERLVRKNLTLLAGITRDRAHALRRAQDHLATYPDLPSALVTHILDRSSAQQAYELAAVPAPGRLKVVVDLVA